MEVMKKPTRRVGFFITDPTGQLWGYGYAQGMTDKAEK